ncbi:MAG: dipeptide ABC transporter ATP-binding protein [Rhizobiales bacterium]|nr:dipeptide ABC transporter ATP-binding protein [Hyphomicrobiales bacterium]
MTDTSRLLAVSGLRIESGNGKVVALKGLDFEIKAGEFLAVVGESGSGKTMAARALMRLLPEGMVRVAGSIMFEGRDITTMSVPDLRALRGREIGMVFQEPMVSLNPALTIGAQLSEGLRLHESLSEEEMARRMVEMLRRVHIQNPEACLSAYPHEFSGGMRQRIMLASVMLLRPKLLIADEPTTALDTLSQREVLDLMVELAKDFGTAVMLITHNLGLVARYATRALVLERGVLVETGSVANILALPQHPYTQRLVDCLPRREPRAPALIEDDAPPLISVRGMRVRFAGRRRLFRQSAPVTAIKNLDLDIYKGETVAVVGGSGCGKTTLGRSILGLIEAEAGDIHFNGMDVKFHSRKARHAFRLGCQLVFQDPYSSLDPRMRIEAIIAEPLRHMPEMTPKQKKDRVYETLSEVGLSDFVGRYPHELSGGQRQRIAIARAVIRRPAFVVADEPVSALDMTIQMQVLGLFQKLQSQYGFACLFISHDLAVVEQIADRVVVMQSGEIVEQGSRDAIFDSPQHAYTRALLEASPAVDLNLLRKGVELAPALQQ